MYSGSSKRQSAIACSTTLWKTVHVLDKLGQDTEAAFGRLVEQDVGRIGIANGHDTDLVGFDLEDTLDGALQRVLQRDHAFGLKPERLNRLDVERIGQIRGPELHEPEFLFQIAIRLRHRATPVAGNQADRETLRFLGTPLGS